MKKEEIQPPKEPEKPKTFKNKFANFWYHYKIPVVLIVAGVILLSFFVYDAIFNKKKYDYEILLATSAYFDEDALVAMENELEKYGEDIDGDGNVNVSVEFIYVGSDEPQMALAGQVKLMAVFAAEDVPLCIFDGDVYQYVYDSTKPMGEDGLADLSADGKPVFIPIGVENDKINDFHQFWNWEDSKLQQNIAFEIYPKNMLFGVRNYGGSDELTKSQIQYLDLLKKVIADS